MRNVALIITSFIIVIIILIILLGNKETSSHSNTLRIATSPWPGYEYLHLAEKKGFFKEENADITLLRFQSLEDAKRAFELGKADAFAATLIELLHVNEGNTETPGKIIMISDYSAGPDVIVAKNDIKTIAGLKGHKVGIEQATLSIFVVSRALEQAGLSIKDVKIVGINSQDMDNDLFSGKIDAVHTYPPASLAILNQKDKVHKIFDSSAIPEEIVGITIINTDLIAQNKKNIAGLKRAWDKALGYANQNPDEANKIMAKLEKITPEEFEESLKGINVLSVAKQQELMNSPKFSATIQKVADVLYNIGELKNRVTNPENFIEK